MKAYFVSADYDGPAYVLTLDEAKRCARGAALNSHTDIVVAQVDIATDRHSILRILNDNGAGAHTVIKDAVYTAKAKPYGSEA